MRILKKKYWPHIVTLYLDLNHSSGTDRANAIHFWLSDNLGKHSEKWYAIQGFRETHYYFRTGEDATTFKLIWA